eukprot:476653-Rhodomonas_salina.2
MVMIGSRSDAHVGSVFVRSGSGTRLSGSLRCRTPQAQPCDRHRLRLVTDVKFTQRGAGMCHAAT